jgi:hypothetical protein
MMEEEAISTTPKPFVFVLMPFDTSFDDIYKFGIKGAAQDAGAYAERVDEQIFTEGILDRVFNQINKADVIVADMTGRNANVFYEVGYAHALGKIVLLLTQNANDIPLDLKHHQHTIYGGKIETLRSELTQKIQWAISESKKVEIIQKSPYALSIGEFTLPGSLSPDALAPTTIILANDQAQYLSIVVLNISPKPSELVSHIYLFSRERSVFRIYSRETVNHAGRVLPPVKAHAANSVDELSRQYRLPSNIPSLPPGTTEVLEVGFVVPSNTAEAEGEERFRVRIHTSELAHDYYFSLAFQKEGASARAKYLPAALK